MKKIPETDIIRAAALAPGDTIGIVWPAGPPRNLESVNAGKKILLDAGFRLREHSPPDKALPYLAASDCRRCETFADHWSDPEVKAILCGRGGYGSLRLLSTIDYGRIRSNPKIFIGFSDITALLSAIHQHTGLITFHGPVLSSLANSDENSLNRFFQSITHTTPEDISSSSIRVLQPGRAEGKIIGGNLATLAHLTATPYEPCYTDNILVIEDINEELYKIDRMLTHMKEAGRLDRLAGLILGSFRNCGDETAIWQRTIELVSNNIPVWGNFPCGHGPENIILPIGARVGMDSASRKLTFLSSCLA